MADQKKLLQKNCFIENIFDLKTRTHPNSRLKVARDDKRVQFVATFMKKLIADLSKCKKCVLSKRPPSDAAGGGGGSFTLSPGERFKDKRYSRRLPVIHLVSN